MDDNFVNPETPNENESEFEQFLKNSQNAAPESESSDGNAEKTMLPEDPQEKPDEDPEIAKKKKKNKGAVALIIVLVLIMIAAIGVMVTVLVRSDSGSDSFDPEKTVVTVSDLASKENVTGGNAESVIGIDNIEISAAEFYLIYMDYYGRYSYYYPEDQLKEMAIDFLVFNNTLYAQALAAGYSLTDEDNQSIDDLIGEIRLQAEAESVSIEEYVEKYVLKDYTIDMYRSFLEKQMLVNNYYEDCMKKLEKELTPGEIEKAYNADITAYDIASFSYWYISAAEENAQEQADQVVEAVKAGSTLDEAIQSVTGDSTKTANKITGYTKSDVTQNFSSEAAEWLFAVKEDGSYENQAGAVTSVKADNGMIYIFCVDGAPHRNEFVPATVAYIEVDIGTDTSVKSEGEQKAIAHSTALKIKEQFDKTDKQYNSFEALMVEYNNGDNELVSGDVFESITPNGTHDAGVEAWSFDEARKVGDCEIVEGDGCYYVLYYKEKAESPVWYSAVKEKLLTDKQTAWQDSIQKLSEGKVVTDDASIDEVIAYVKSSAQNAMAQ